MMTFQRMYSKLFYYILSYFTTSGDSVFFLWRERGVWFHTPPTSLVEVLPPLSFIIICCLVKFTYVC